MLSFMDGFSEYNQILMAPEDMEKASFIIEWGTYCHRVMPFGLKNARTTYHRAATTLFHDMMYRDMEVYMDDMIVKSQSRSPSSLREILWEDSEIQIEAEPQEMHLWSDFWEIVGAYG